MNFQAPDVQKPRDRITGLEYSNSCRYLLGSDRNQILAGLASNVTTSLIPSNDINRYLHP